MSTRQDFSYQPDVTDAYHNENLSPDIYSALSKKVDTLIRKPINCTDNSKDMKGQSSNKSPNERNESEAYRPKKEVSTLIRKPINSTDNLKDVKGHSPNESEAYKRKKQKLSEFREDESDVTPDDDDDNVQFSVSPRSAPEIKHESNKSKKSQNDTKWLFEFGLRIIICIVCCIATYYFFFKNSTNEIQINTNEIQINTNEIVISLEKKFTNQPQLSFKIIKASIKKILNTTNSKPTQPSILLLMSSKEAKEVLNGFAHELALLTSATHKEYLIINGGEYTSENSSIAMKKINDKIDSECSSKEPAVVLMENLDKIPAQAALTFISYFDHENAPYKRVIFISTISIAEPIPKSADSKTIDILAENHLKKAWSFLSEDQLFPLLTRITVSVAAILPDNPSSNVRY